MVTIYYDTRTVRVRMPVLSLGRWSGALLVRLQDCCEERLEEIVRLRDAHRATRLRRVQRDAASVRRAELDRDRAFAQLQGRGV